MPEVKWNLENIQETINSGDFTKVTAADLVEMDKVLRDPALNHDNVIVAARAYLSEAAERRIAELAEKNWDDTNDDDLDSFVDLLDRFSSRDASGYKGKAAEVMKKIELRRELLKNQREEIEAKRLKRLETLTPAELWELRKKLREQNSPEAQEENKKLEEFILAKTTQFVDEPAFAVNDEQAPVLKELLEDIKENPLTMQTDLQKEVLIQALVKVDEQIADFEERHRLEEEARNDETFEKSLRLLEGMPSDEVLFKRGEDGKLQYPEFEEIDNILSHLQVKGELTLLGRKSVDQTSQDSDIALFRERIRWETQVALAGRNPEEITEEAFRQEYAARLNQGIFEVVYANSIVAGKTSKKDMLKLVSELSKSAQKGTTVSVHQDVLSGWHAGHQAEFDLVAKRMKMAHQMPKSAKTLGARQAVLKDKCQKKYSNTYNRVSGLLKTAGWGVAYGIATNPAVMAWTGGASLAAVATASFLNSGWRFYKSYKKARDEAAGRGKKLGFWSYVKKNKAQSAGVLLSATAALTAGLDVAGLFAGNPEVLAGITQVRVGTGLALWGASTAKQVGDAYRRGGLRAAAGTAGLSLLSFGTGAVAGRLAGSILPGPESEAVNQVDAYTGESIPVQSEQISGQNVDIPEAENLSIAGGEVAENVSNEVKAHDGVGSHVHVVHNQPDVSGGDETALSPDVQDAIDRTIAEMQNPDLLKEQIDIQIKLPDGVQEEIDRTIAELQNPDFLKEQIDIHERPQPLFTPEGINEDGSIYGTRGNGDSVSAAIDEEGKFERITIKGNDLSEERLNWINEHPGVSEGLEERAIETVRLAKEISSQEISEPVQQDTDIQIKLPDGVQEEIDHTIAELQNPDFLKEQVLAGEKVFPSAASLSNEEVVANMDKYLDGEWQDHDVQAAETKDMPGTPMSVEDTPRPGAETISGEEIVGSHINMEGWEKNSQGVEIDPNPNRPAILRGCDKVATLGWADGENLKPGEVIRERGTDGYMQVLGRDNEGNLFKLYENTSGQPSLDVPPGHPLYDKLNTPLPSEQVIDAHMEERRNEFEAQYQKRTEEFKSLKDMTHEERREYMHRRSFENQRSISSFGNSLSSDPTGKYLDSQTEVVRYGKSMTRMFYYGDGGQNIVNSGMVRGGGSHSM